MKIDILTLFPKMFEGFLQESIIKRAIEKKIVEINIIDFRTFSKRNNNQVDDTPYGGGGGMVLMPDPIVDAIEYLRKENSKVILMCPQGHPYNEQQALRLKEEKHLILVCGHYEGFDERIRNFVDEEISIGDYILTGGELPAMVVTDSIVRLIKGVIKEDSWEKESFMRNRLDYPVYTKPYDFRGLKVPDVLVSGNHKKIKEWREEKALENTIKKRSDLLKEKGLDDI